MATFNPADVPAPPARVQERYRSTGTWRDRTFTEIFDEVLAEFPESRIVGPAETVTFGSLADRVEEVAAGLRSHGIGRGDVVSYQLPNRTSTCLVHLAATRVGATVNPILISHRHSEVEHILSDAGTRCLFVPDTYRGFDYQEMAADVRSTCPELEEVFVVDPDRGTGDVLPNAADGRTASAETSPDDVHAILYTSGTTGNPKGVCHTHNTLNAHHQRYIAGMALSEATTFLIGSPIAHALGMCYGLQLPFVTGMGLVVMDRWDAEQAIDLINRESVNFMVTPTTLLQELLDAAPPDWDNPLRVFSCGGADVPPEIIPKACRTLNCTVKRSYGSTEYPVAATNPLDASIEKRSETDGRPAGQAVIVDTETGDQCATGETGELVVRGPALTVGYTDGDLTEAAFDDGWFATGDLARTDADGYITIVGRLKDVIIRGGENIPVKAVEDRLYEHPAVEDVAIVAMPDPDFQERACAFVSVADGHSFSFREMIGVLEAEGISKKKFPERLEIREELPKTSTGKIQKRTLRQAIAAELDRDPITRE